MVSLIKSKSKCKGEMDMNIGIVGVGGVGGYFGGKLAARFEKDETNHVYFLARGEHLKKIKENGLLLISDEKEPVYCKPYFATDSLEDFPVLDVCIICVKAYDLVGVLNQLKTKLTPQTEVLPLLNGIDIPRRIHDVLPDILVYPACVYVGTHIKSPGVIEQTGGEAKIFVGPTHEHAAEMDNPPRFTKLFDEAGILYKWTKDNYIEIWKKYMVVGPYSIVTAYFDQTVGQVYQNPELRAKVLAIAQLVWQIADKEGVHLPESWPQVSVDKMKEYPFDLKTSFHRDFERKDKPNEKEIFIDSILLLAEKYGLDASCVYDIVHK